MNTCSPTKSCDVAEKKIDELGCHVDVSRTGASDQPLVSSQPRFANVDTSESVDIRTRQDPFEEETEQPAWVRELAIHSDDLQWLGRRSIIDEEGPRLRLDLRSKVHINDEVLTLGEVLQNTNPGYDCLDCFDRASSSFLEARRFRLDDIVDVECEVLDGILDDDDRPDLMSMRLAHCLRELNSHMIKHLRDKYVDWQKARLSLQRRGYLLRQASAHNIPIENVQGPSLGRRYSKSPNIKDASHQSEPVSQGSNNSRGFEVRQPNDGTVPFNQAQLDEYGRAEPTGDSSMVKQSRITGPEGENKGSNEPDNLQLKDSKRACTFAKCDWL